MTSISEPLNQLLFTAAWFLEPQNCPEFSKLSRNLIEEVILESQDDCPVRYWGGNPVNLKDPNTLRRIRAIKYLTAHKLKIRYSQMGVFAGEAVESAKGGTPSLPKTEANEDDYMATFYGRQFIRIRNQMPVSGIVC